MLIAMDLEMAFRERGAVIADLCTSVAEALSLLETELPDAVVLDMRLGAASSIPVAMELQKRGIPFVFTTGYDDKDMIPEELEDTPVVQKPYDADVVFDVLRDLCFKKRT